MRLDDCRHGVIERTCTKCAQHTPTPWKIGRNGFIVSGKKMIARNTMPPSDYKAPVSFEEGEANAAYIVRAVNAYESLMELLTECRRSGMVETDIPESLYIKLEAIAKAEGAK